MITVDRCEGGQRSSYLEQYWVGNNSAKLKRVNSTVVTFVKVTLNALFKLHFFLQAPCNFASFHDALYSCRNHVKKHWKVLV